MLKIPPWGLQNLPFRKWGFSEESLKIILNVQRLLSFVGRHVSSQTDREMRRSHKEERWPRLCTTLAGLHQLRKTEMGLQGTRVVVRRLVKEEAHHGHELHPWDGGSTWLPFVNVLDFTRMWISFVQILKTLKMSPSTLFSKGNPKMLPLVFGKADRIFFFPYQDVHFTMVPFILTSKKVNTLFWYLQGSLGMCTLHKLIIPQMSS